MVNKFLILVLFATLVQSKEVPPLVQQNCLNCHMQQKIPSEFIYRRYLMKLSTKERIKEHLFSYLKNPEIANSIMPKQFFLKFPKKKALDLNDTLLEESIEAYLDYFDVKKKLRLKNHRTATTPK